MTNVNWIERAEKQSYFQSLVVLGRRSVTPELIIQLLRFLQGFIEIFIDKNDIELIAETHLELRFEQPARKTLRRFRAAVIKSFLQYFQRWHFNKNGERFVTEIFF